MWRSLGASPIVWVIAGALGIILADAIIRPLADQATGIISLILALAEGVIVIIVYKLTMNHLARRSTPELSGQRAGVEAGMGLLTGALFVLVSAFTIVAAGGYSIQWANAAEPGSALGASIASALGAAIVEELIFRGLLFQAIRQWAGNGLALAVTSLFFGVAHLGNTGATLWSGFAITIEAGLLLGAAFLWRRNLWFVIGLHCAWNAIESLLGTPVSGHAPDGLYTVQASGSALLTGGDFGLEGSVVPVLISLAMAIPMLIRARRPRE
ncbi:CPBP family intramembrane metalloprotease [Cohnella fermenti]|uniref:CPBP family intramembrane metalloprotease n=2 Tax=Cohnella fermenti TaxID=2565925 RepID=A0A4S4C8D7_9BACL|nr:CPBP family intramembrane metalloprotease [Cohnella fermenti]